MYNVQTTECRKKLKILLDTSGFKIHALHTPSSMNVNAYTNKNTCNIDIEITFDTRYFTSSDRERISLF